MKQFYETYRNHEKLSTLLRELPWSSHLHILAKTKNLEEKEFYLRLAVKEKYSVIRRFKVLEEVRCELNGMNMVLAGRNSTGKTTILQAIAAWSLAFQRWKALNDFQRHGGYYAKAPIARQAFCAVPLRRFDLMWANRDYTGNHRV